MLKTEPQAYLYVTSDLLCLSELEECEQFWKGLEDGLHLKESTLDL